jgi:hypothetical protein
MDMVRKKLHQSKKALTLDPLGLQRYYNRRPSATSSESPVCRFLFGLRLPALQRDVCPLRSFLVRGRYVHSLLISRHDLEVAHCDKIRRH